MLHPREPRPFWSIIVSRDGDVHLSVHKYQERGAGEWRDPGLLRNAAELTAELRDDLLALIARARK